MDLLGFGIIMLLVVVSGLIAYIGDYVGRRVGKKRISIFGLRPKHTSIIVTIITGIVIVSFTLGVLLAVSEQARTAFFGLQNLISELNEKESELEQLKELTKKYEREEARLMESLEEVNSRYSESREALSRKQSELDDILGAINLKTVELAELQESVEEMNVRIETLDAERRALEAERERLEKRKSQLEAQIVRLAQDNAEILGDTKRDILFGQIVYKKDEALGRTVVPEDATGEEIEELLLDMINRIFREAIELGAKVDEDAYEIFRAQLGSLRDVLRRSGGDLIVEARSHTNVLVDQPIYITLAVVDDYVVYEKGQVIEKAVISPGLDQKQISSILSSMLASASVAARKNGMIPDKATGRVGYIPARRYISFVKQLTAIGEAAAVELYAVDDVHISERLEVDFRITQ